MVPTFRRMQKDLDNQQFITDVYFQYQHLMLWETEKYINNHQDREDAIQNSLVSLIAHTETLRKLDEKSLVTYIIFTVRNTCFNFLKHQKIMRLHFNDEIDIESLTHSENEMSIDCAHSVGTDEQIRMIWSKLSEKDKILLEGKYIWGYNNKELAEIIECNQANVRMYLTRARRNALRIIQAEEQKNDST